MRLRNKNEAPIGGWKYTFTDDQGNSYTSTGVTLRTLTQKVNSDMRVNNVTVPPNLQDFIEDQICQRQPPKSCFYEDKAGDQISKYIHIFAGGIDKAAASIGLKTNLEQSARRCRGCGNRRVRLNQ